MMASVEAAWAAAERAAAELDLGCVDTTLVRRAQTALRHAIAAAKLDDRPVERRAQLIEPRIVAAIVSLRLRPDPGPTRPKPAPQDRRGKHRELREGRIAAGLCTSCGRARDLPGVTCGRCLETDKKWRKDRAVREKTAQYLDDECQPLVLKFPTRMLPVLGNRYDCLREDDCLSELIKACGWQDAPGSSCPKDCKDRVERDPKNEFGHQAMSRDEMV